VGWAGRRVASVFHFKAGQGQKNAIILAYVFMSTCDIEPYCMNGVEKYSRIL
jgi:hypothetical protein